MVDLEKARKNRLLIQHKKSGKIYQVMYCTNKSAEIKSITTGSWTIGYRENFNYYKPKKEKQLEWI